MIIEEIKVDTSETHPHVIPEVEKSQKIDILMERTGKHKYNNRSRTNRVNHVTIFNNALNMF